MVDINKDKNNNFVIHTSAWVGEDRIKDLISSSSTFDKDLNLIKSDGTKSTITKHKNYLKVHLGIDCLKVVVWDWNTYKIIDVYETKKSYISEGRIFSKNESFLANNKLIELVNKYNKIKKETEKELANLRILIKTHGKGGK